MNSLKWVLSISILIATGCSFTKPESPVGKAVDKKEISLQGLPSKQTQQQIFDLILSTDYVYIKTTLQSIGKVNFEFKDSSGQSPASLLFKIGDEQKIRIFAQAGLSIYQSESSDLDSLIESDRKRALAFLNKYNQLIGKSDSSLAANTPVLNYHRQAIAEILDLLANHQNYEALVLLKNKNLSCQFATKSLILNSISRDIRPATDSIVQLVKQAGCDRLLNSEDLSMLLNVEATRQFQGGFSDADLFLYLLKSPHLNDKMISVGDDGLKVSPYLLIQLAKNCEISVVQKLSDNPLDRFLNKRCNGDHEGEKDDLIVANVKSLSSPSFERCRASEYSADCMREVGVLSLDFDISAIQNHVRVFAWKLGDPNFDLSTFSDQIEDAMFGRFDMVAFKCLRFLDGDGEGNCISKDSFKNYISSPLQVELIADIKAVQQRIMNELDLEKRVKIMNAFQETFAAKYLDPMLPPDSVADEASDHLAASDPNNEEYESRKLIFRYLPNFDETQNLSKQCKEWNEEGSLGWGEFSWNTVYQLSLRHGRHEILIDYDFVRAVCDGPKKENRH